MQFNTEENLRPGPEKAKPANPGLPAPVRGGSSPDESANRDARAGIEWFTPRRFAFILAASIFAAYPEVVLGVRTFFFRDFGYFGYPLAFHHRESFWRAEVPLWNPLNDCGLPFLAQWNTMVLYPGSLFCLVFPLSWSLAVFCLLHQFLSGLGMYLLAMRWTRNRFAASVAGVIFAFNGLALNCLMWPNNIAAFGWMPWVVLQVERAWNEGGRQTILASAFAVMQMLTGAPEIILLTWAVLTAMLGAQSVCSGSRRVLFLKRFLAVALLLTGLAAVQLLPFFDLLTHSQRDTSYGRSAWSLPGTGWANFLVPLFHCFSSPANQGVFFQYDQWWTSSYYVGVGPLVLALVAVWRLREHRVWFLASLLAMSAVLALGDNGYLYKWIRQAVPLFGLLRYPIKFVVVAIFSLPLLAAFAVARMPVREAGDALRFRRMLYVSWAGTLAVMVAILWFAWQFPFQWDEWPATLKNALGRAACFTLFLALLLAAQTAGKLNLRRLLHVAVLFVTWLDFMTHTPRQNPTVPRAAYEPGLVRLSPAPAHGVSRAMISPAADTKFRSIAVSEGLKQYIGNRLGLFSNCNLLDDIPKLNGFFSLYLREADQVRALLYLSGNTNLSRLLDFLNVSHITAPDKLFDWVTRTNFLPFVSAGQRPVFADGATALRSLAAPDFTPREKVYLPLGARSMVTAGPTSARILSSRFTAQRGEIEVDAQDRSLVVISQAYYPAWKARVDGRSVPLWPANYAFQALEVPAGPHQVVLTYDDHVFYLGSIISILTLAGCWRWSGRGILKSPLDNRHPVAVEPSFPLTLTLPRGEGTTSARRVFCAH
jgi:Bacterial membrane protein YfhO